jgi:hypothetical protein
MTAPAQNDGATNSTNGVPQTAPAKRVPLLAHRMKHDKSILALAVSWQYIFAGTQGGEILVSNTVEVVERLKLTRYGRFTASTRTSAEESSTRTKAASLDSACRKTRSCSFRAPQIRSSMYGVDHMIKAYTKVTGLVHIHLPAPLRVVVALRHRRHLLRRILVHPPHCLPRSTEYQHTGEKDIQ